MCILPVRPPCTALSADPSSHTSFVNTMLNAIRQVNKQRGAPQRLNGTEELLMPQTGQVGGNVWGVNEELCWGPRWGCCLHIPVVGQRRRPCHKTPPPHPPQARDWISRSHCLTVTLQRKWNWGETYFVIIGASTQCCSFIGRSGDFQCKRLHAAYTHLIMWEPIL